MIVLPPELFVANLVVFGTRDRSRLQNKNWCGVATINLANVEPEDARERLKDYGDLRGTFLPCGRNSCEVLESD